MGRNTAESRAWTPGLVTSYTLFRGGIAESSNGTTDKGFCLGPGGCKACSTANFRVPQLLQMLAYHWLQGIIAINRYAPLFNIDMHRDNTFQCLQATDNTARTTTTLDIFYINLKRHNQSPSLENHRGCNPLLHLYLTGFPLSLPHAPV